MLNIQTSKNVDLRTLLPKSSMNNESEIPFHNTSNVEHFYYQASFKLNSIFNSVTRGLYYHYLWKLHLSQNFIIGYFYLKIHRRLCDGAHCCTFSDILKKSPFIMFFASHHFKVQTSKNLILLIVSYKTKQLYNIIHSCVGLILVYWHFSGTCCFHHDRCTLLMETP
jgi:hypothetical protein